MVVQPIRRRLNGKQPNPDAPANAKSSKVLAGSGMRSKEEWPCQCLGKQYAWNDEWKNASH